MTMICPKCGHQRNANDDPEVNIDQCPACGIYYFKYINQQSGAPRPKPAPPKHKTKPAEPESFRPEPTDTEKLLVYQELATQKTNHILHFLLSIVTFGLWLIIWMIISANNTGKRNKIREKYGLPIENDPMGLIIKIFLGIYLTSIVVSKCSMTEKPSSIQPKPSQTQIPASTIPNQIIQKTVWKYSQSEDKMGRGVSKNAVTASINQIEFGFPYRGKQHAILNIRAKHNKSLDIMLYLDKAHFLCHRDECGVTVRFDDNIAEYYSASQPQSLETNLIFIGNAIKFFENIKKSKKLWIEATFYKEGNIIFEFDVNDLNMN